MEIEMEIKCRIRQSKLWCKKAKGSTGGGEGGKWQSELKSEFSHCSFCTQCITVIHLTVISL